MTLLDNCIFCKIIKGSIPCYKVFENAKTLAFMDINPISKGHILVIPKYHGERLHSIPAEHLADLLPTISAIAERSVAAEGVAYNVLQNNGRLAGQIVDHVHFHLIPRRGEEDGLNVSWPAKSGDMEAMKKEAADLQSKFGQ